MKIIIKGDNKKPWAGFKTKCHACESILELENSDSPKLVSDSRDGDYYELGCPICSKTITLDAQMVRIATSQSSLT